MQKNIKSYSFKNSCRNLLQSWKRIGQRIVYYFVLLQTLYIKACRLCILLFKLTLKHWITLSQEKRQFNHLFFKFWTGHYFPPSLLIRAEKFRYFRTLLFLKPSEPSDRWAAAKPGKMADSTHKSRDNFSWEFPLSKASEIFNYQYKGDSDQLRLNHGTAPGSIMENYSADIICKVDITWVIKEWLA